MPFGAIKNGAIDVPEAGPGYILVDFTRGGINDKNMTLGVNGYI
jgi:hypothetical protein